MLTEKYKNIQRSWLSVISFFSCSIFLLDYFFGNGKVFSKFDHASFDSPKHTVCALAGGWLFSTFDLKKNVLSLFEKQESQSDEFHQRNILTLTIITLSFISYATIFSVKRFSKNKSIETHELMCLIGSALLMITYLNQYGIEVERTEDEMLPPNMARIPACFKEEDPSGYKKKFAITSLMMSGFWVFYDASENAVANDLLGHTGFYLASTVYAASLYYWTSFKEQKPDIIVKQQANISKPLELIDTLKGIRKLPLEFKLLHLHHQKMSDEEIIKVIGDRKTDKKTNKKTGKKTGKKTAKKTAKKTDKKTGKKTDKKTNEIEMVADALEQIEGLAKDIQCPRETVFWLADFFSTAQKPEIMQNRKLFKLRDSIFFDNQKEALNFCFYLFGSIVAYYAVNGAYNRSLDQNISFEWNTIFIPLLVSLLSVWSLYKKTCSLINSQINIKTLEVLWTLCDDPKNKQLTLLMAGCFPSLGWPKFDKAEKAKTEKQKSQIEVGKAKETEREVQSAEEVGVKEKCAKSIQTQDDIMSSPMISSVSTKETPVYVPSIEQVLGRVIPGFKDKSKTEQVSYMLGSCEGMDLFDEWLMHYGLNHAADKADYKKQAQSIIQDAQKIKAKADKVQRDRQRQNEKIQERNRKIAQKNKEKAKKLKQDKVKERKFQELTALESRYKKGTQKDKVGLPDETLKNQEKYQTRQLDEKKQEQAQVKKATILHLQIKYGQGLEGVDKSQVLLDYTDSRDLLRLLNSKGVCFGQHLDTIVARLIVAFEYQLWAKDIDVGSEHYQETYKHYQETKKQLIVGLDASSYCAIELKVLDLKNLIDQERKAQILSGSSENPRKKLFKKRQESDASKLSIKEKQGRAILELKPLGNMAALTLQKQYRSFICSKSFKQKKAAVLKLQKYFRHQKNLLALLAAEPHKALTCQVDCDSKKDEAVADTPGGTPESAGAQSPRSPSPHELERAASEGIAAESPGSLSPYDLEAVASENITQCSGSPLPLDGVTPFWGVYHQPFQSLEYENIEALLDAVIAINDLKGQQCDMFLYARMQELKELVSALKDKNPGVVFSIHGSFAMSVYQYLRYKGKVGFPPCRDIDIIVRGKCPLEISVPDESARVEVRGRFNQLLYCSGVNIVEFSAASDSSLFKNEIAIPLDGSCSLSFEPMVLPDDFRMRGRPFDAAFLKFVLSMMVMVLGLPQEQFLEGGLSQEEQFLNELLDEQAIGYYLELKQRLINDVKSYASGQMQPTPIYSCDYSLFERFLLKLTSIDHTLEIFSSRDASTMIMLKELSAAYNENIIGFINSLVFEDSLYNYDEKSIGAWTIWTIHHMFEDYKTRQTKEADANRKPGGGAIVKSWSSLPQCAP